MCKGGVYTIMYRHLPKRSKYSAQDLLRALLVLPHSANRPFFSPAQDRQGLDQYPTEISTGIFRLR